MKRRYIAVIVLLILFFAVNLASCSNEKVLKADTPANAGWLMKIAIDRGDYDSFNKLFSDGRKDSVSKKKFAEYKEITTAESYYRHYELITFTNGEMLLVRLTPDKVNGEYKIEDVVRVADDRKKLFSDE